MRMTFFFVSTFLLFISCNKNPAIQDNPVNERFDCKECSYVPMCDGQRYIYEHITNNGTTMEVRDTLQYIKDTNINAVMFRKFRFATNNYVANQYHTCVGNITLHAFYFNLGGNTLTLKQSTRLNPNLSVNDHWSDSLVYSSGVATIYKNTIIEKGITRTVNGRGFSDVIHILVETTRYDPSSGIFPLDNTDYYYARGVGLIETNSTNPIFGTFRESIKIKEYFIP